MQQTAALQIPSFLLLLRSCPHLIELDLQLVWTKAILDEVHRHMTLHDGDNERKTKNGSIFPLSIQSLHLIANISRPSNAILIDQINIVIDLLRPLLELKKLRLNFRLDDEQTLPPPVTAIALASTTNLTNEQMVKMHLINHLPQLISAVDLRISLLGEPQPNDVDSNDDGSDEAEEDEADDNDAMEGDGNQ
jgi:hypothetical protein